MDIKIYKSHAAYKNTCLYFDAYGFSIEVICLKFYEKRSRLLGLKKLNVSEVRNTGF